MDSSTLTYDDNGLIPAIVQDYNSGKVLMLAYMNSESLAISLAEKKTCFYSRSRRELWRKGETSGNTQEIATISADCDGDCLLVQVIPAGPACHTGEPSCFYNPILETTLPSPFLLDSLYTLLVEREKERTQGSYTTYLFTEGLDKILKKVGEEATEVVIAAKNRNESELIYEVSDLVYHILVLLVEQGITPTQIKEELANRYNK